MSILKMLICNSPRATASRLKTEELYYGWNFNNIWSLENSTFPYIKLNGKYNGIDVEGFGDNDDPYIIETEEQLIAMFNGEIGPSSKAYYELANDITVTARDWTPIGANGTNAFNGVFDGKGHTISGITLKNTHYENVGLFGSNSGTIKNLNVDVTLEGVNNVGGLVAYNTGTIENCTVTGTISGTDNSSSSIGGLVGYNSGTIKNSSSNATVTSANGNAGGLVGTQYNGGYIELSYATGCITSTNGSAGGLIGRIDTSYGNSVVRYSYATGSVSGNYAGGLVGRNYSNGADYYSLIEHCYAHGTVTSANYAGGLVGYSSYGNNSVNTIQYCYATGVVNEGSGAGFLGGYNNISSNTIRYCYYNEVNKGNRIGFPTTTDVMTISDTYYGWNFENIWSLDNSTYPYIKLNGTYYGVDVEGGGDDDDPYIIETEEQLIAMFNGEIGPSSKAYYELANDITVTARDWTPIGANGTNAFNGVFDGKGHTISGITLKNTHYESVGLFGSNTGTIKNLNVNVILEGTTNVGGLVAYNTGTIENCTVAGIISGTDNSSSSIGGLVGYNVGTIKNSSSTVTVTALNGNVGGLVGLQYNGGNIELSYATGNVTSTNGYAGGLIGRIDTSYGNSVVRYSYASGNVTGNYAGGLVGRNNSNGSSYYSLIENCYSLGNVTATNYGGGLIGYASYGNNSTNTIQYCYSNGAVNASTAGGLIGYNNKSSVLSSYYNKNNSGCIDIDRGTPLTDDSMKKQSSFIGWNFTSDWVISSSVNSGYPYLKSLVPTTVISVSGVSLNKTSTTLTVGETETLTATVAPDNATNKTVSWTSSNASVATVSNGKITAKAAGTATITVTTADGSKTATCVVTVTTNASSVTIGDANGDGDVDFADAIVVLEHDAGITTLTGDKLTAADVNGDGNVDFVDAIQILKYDGGLISSFN